MNQAEHEKKNAYAISSDCTVHCTVSLSLPNLLLSEATNATKRKSERGERKKLQHKQIKSDSC